MATEYTQRKYEESDAVKNWKEQMAANTGLKPSDYVSKYQPQIDSIADSILNRKDFQYDVNADALYQQYKDRYVDLGQKAMMDTMGQAAKLTGGYGNSNAQMVGQQAYQGYLQGLTDKIPELAQLAYQRYAQQGQDLYQKYGLLNTQEQAAVDQWNAAYNRWLAERDFLTGRYDTERGYDYGTFRDSVADDQWKAQFDEDIRRFDFANKLGEFAVAAAPAAAAYYGGGGDVDYSGVISNDVVGGTKTYDVHTKEGQLAMRAEANAATNAAYQSGAITKEQYIQEMANNRLVR
jgi:hypothetical protein